MRDLSLSEMLLAKESLGKLMSQARQTVRHYKFDNGRFSVNGFIDAINQKYQKIIFCGFGRHHHNGIVENKNKILTTGASTLLPHGMIMWIQMTDEMFCPFPMKSFF